MCDFGLKSGNLRKKKPLNGQRLICQVFALERRWQFQAMETAIKASRNISTPPTIGNTMGINGTMASTGSTSVVSGAAGWLAGADMAGFQKIKTGLILATPA
jgi:hypothetical protein